MNDKKTRRRDYAKLRRVLFTKTLILGALSVVCVLLLRELFRGRMANWIVNWLHRVASMDLETAVNFYFYQIRTNMEYLIGIVILIFILLLFWVLLHTFQSYFNRIVQGIDQILDGEDPILLPPELQFVEQKLNHAKQTLQRREHEAALQEQQKNDLIVYLAHDIRTPLTSVIGYLSLLDEEPGLSDAKKEKYIRISREKATRLEGLVNEFFELTRYHLQTVPLEKTRISLCYMLVQLADELYPQLTAAGKTIENTVDEQAEVYADADKLARAFDNILKNAIAYSDAQSVIRVSAHREADQILILFQNQGSIPTEALENIFEKFYRGNPARSSQTGGAGLGLTIARDIIALHGGSIRAESAGGQTVFTVSLPLEA